MALLTQNLTRKLNGCFTPLPSPQLRQLSFYLIWTYTIINIDSSVFQEKTNLLLTLMALLLAGLQESQPSKAICSSTLVGNNIVLTSSNCIGSEGASKLMYVLFLLQTGVEFLFFECHRYL